MRTVLFLFGIVFLIFAGCASQVTTHRSVLMPGSASGAVAVNPQVRTAPGPVMGAGQAVYGACKAIERFSFGIIICKARLHVRVNPPQFRSRVEYRNPLPHKSWGGSGLRTPGRYTIHIPYGRAAGIPKIQRREGTP